MLIIWNNSLNMIFKLFLIKVSLWMWIWNFSMTQSIKNGDKSGGYEWFSKKVAIVKSILRYFINLSSRFLCP